MSVNGWPFVNHATNLRMMNSVSRTGIETGIPLGIPRYRFTWLADIIPNDTTSITNLADLGLRQGHLYTHLKTAGLPNPTFKTEKLNSYNRRYNIQTKMELGQFTMTFHDDATSFAMALVKELINHANWVGNIGNGLLNDLNKNVNQGLMEYTFGTSGTQSFINPDRSKLSERPTLGMKLQDCSRTWLSHVILYDLGTEPDSINVYVYQNPVLSGLDHTPLDNYDRTGFGEITLTFDYENYFFLVGQPHSQVKAFINRILGTESPIQRASNMHAKQSNSFDRAMDWAAQCMAQCGNPVPEKDTVSTLVDEILNGRITGGNTDIDSIQEQIRTGEILPTQGGLQSAPALNQQETAVYLRDRLERAEANYELYYGDMDVDTPEAAIRRQEIENLRVMSRDANIRAASENQTLMPDATKQAVTNIQERYALTPSTQKNMTLIPNGGLTPTQGVANSPITPTPIQRRFVGQQTIADPSVPFSKFNQEYMKTFKAGVTK